MPTSRAIAALVLLLACSRADPPAKTEPSADASPPASSSSSPLFVPRRPVLASRDMGRTWATVADTAIPEAAEVTLLEAWGARLVVGTEAHFLFAGNPRGGTWASLGAGLPAPKITALAADGEELYVGVYEAGLFVTREGGSPWRAVENLPEMRVRAVFVVGRELVAAGDGGVWRSHDRRSSWKNVFGACQVVSLVGAHDELVAGGACGTFLSSDAGETWRPIHEGAAHGVAKIGDRIALMNISGDLFLSSDRGRTWAEPTYAPREQSYVYDVVGSGDQLVASNNYGLHASNDGGAHWEHVLFTEDLVFIDLLVLDGVLYGGTRSWNEYRQRTR
jgi:photosystem II stability/assembly factor-like uncharacterized protein